MKITLAMTNFGVYRSYTEIYSYYDISINHIPPRLYFKKRWRRIIKT